MDTNYNLNTERKSTTRAALRKMMQFMKGEKRHLYIAFFVMAVNAGVTMLAPYLIGYTIDHFIMKHDYHGLMIYSFILFGLFVVWAATEYFQAKTMGNIGQRMLFSLRNEVFNKLQQLPVAFFNMNKTGDLISRINNDTDNVNQFFSQSLMRFMDSIFTIIGAGAFLLAINLKLGAATLIPAVFILAFVLIISPFVKKKNAASLKATGALSAEIQESMHNFKTIIAFNCRDYFRKRFALANKDNYKTSVVAGISNGIFSPVFTLFSNAAQLIVLGFGIYLIIKGNFTVGLLISFISYTQNFYYPLQQLAQLWAGFQTAMAAWDRISVILNLNNDMPQMPTQSMFQHNQPKYAIQFRNVSFQYPDGKKVLHHINFDMEAGKTYALVGPTGGGKSTTAYLIARLYDPTEGMVLMNGVDIRSYTSEERTKAIGFILQEPFLFTGTLRENILYGNEEYQNVTEEELAKVIGDAGLSALFIRFEKGLDTELQSANESVSLGQKQLIVFIRAVLRKPKILILDEASANIDTITEKLLDDILQKLPQDTTRIIIAHRLNTIENADEIFFVNAGEVTPAGTFDHALDMLLQGKRVS